MCLCVCLCMCTWLSVGLSVDSALLSKGIGGCSGCGPTNGDTTRGEPSNSASRHGPYVYAHLMHVSSDCLSVSVPVASPLRWWWCSVGHGRCVRRYALQLAPPPGPGSRVCCTTIAASHGPSGTPHPSLSPPPPRPQTLCTPDHLISDPVFLLPN